MNSATPWWGTLVVAAVGFVGIASSQWLSGRRERTKTETEHLELARQRRVEAYGEFMAKFQAVIFAVDGPEVNLPDEEQVIPAMERFVKAGIYYQTVGAAGM